MGLLLLLLLLLLLGSDCCWPMACQCNAAQGPQLMRAWASVIQHCRHNALLLLLLLLGAGGIPASFQCGACI
jgi:hypothetical protein